MNDKLRLWLFPAFVGTALYVSAQPGPVPGFRLGKGGEVVPARQLALPVPGQIPVVNGGELKDAQPVRSSTPARTSNPPKAKAPVKPKERPDKLKFLNGDSLSGRFQGIIDGNVVWQYPAFTEPAKVKLSAVEQIRIIPRDKKNLKHNCSVELVNGDWFTGDLVSLNEEGLELDTWYGGRLKLPRQHVRFVRPGQVSSRILYEGPDGSPEGWKTGNRNNSTVPMAPFGNNNFINPANGPAAPQQLALQIIGKQPIGRAVNSNIAKWRFVDNGFNCSTSGPMLGRNDMALPDKLMMEFDFQWSNYFSLGVNLYADTIKNEYTGNSYSLRIDRSNVYLYRIDNSRQVRVGVNVQSGMSTKTRSRVTICVDRPKRLFALLMDGRLIHKWEDKGAKFAGKGNGILFTSRNSYPMRLSNMTISEWDGNIPDAGGDKKGNGKEDFVKFVNEDTLSGTAQSLKDGKLTMKAAFGETPLDFKTIALLELANPRVNAKPDAGEIRIRLLSHGQVTVDIEEWVGDKVRVRSPYFGTAEFDPAVFEKLEFNRHIPRRASGDNIFGP